MSIGDRDFITTEEIAKALGGRRHAGYWTAKCPAHDDRVPSLSLRDGDDGKVLLCCFGGCDSRDVISALISRGLWPNHDARRVWTPSPIRPKPQKPQEPDNAARAREIWNDATDPRGTPVELYLASRGLSLTADIAIRVIRFHSRCPFGPGKRYPCLVARFSPIKHDYTPEAPPSAIHRIRLDAVMDDEVRKLSLGPQAGQCVKLSHDEDVTTGLGITEGIEDGLSLTGIGWRPIWALCGKAGIASFPVLGGVETLTVFADHDRSGAGLAAAEKCEDRWLRAGFECQVLMPERPGDWNDEILR